MKRKISKITAREILDSRGNPAIETCVWSGKDFAIASVPSGASTGSHEAMELRDGDKKRYAGMGVKKAIANIHKKIAPLLVGKEVDDQSALDQLMIEKDGTKNKSKLGANAILSVSLATSRLSAQISGQPLYKHLAKANGYKIENLPTPLCNVINGGVHADSGLDIQEFFLIPQKGSFSDKLQRAHKIIGLLKKRLATHGYSVSVGDEGGFAPQLRSNEKALRFLADVVKLAGFKLGKEIALGFDAAASEFFDDKKEIYRFQADQKNFKPTSVYKLYQRWVDDYHIKVIEDGCSEDDFVGWQHLTHALGSHVTLVGDDLFVTNPQRIQTGIIAGIANAVLIKPNQIGTLTETLASIKMAQKYGYKVIISHRSGETNDSFIADLAVAVNADYIKAGSLARGERMAKYNRLLEIEAELK